MRGRSDWRCGWFKSVFEGSDVEISDSSGFHWLETCQSTLKIDFGGFRCQISAKMQREKPKFASKSAGHEKEDEIHLEKRQKGKETEKFASEIAKDRRLAEIYLKKR